MRLVRQPADQSAFRAAHREGCLWEFPVEQVIIVIPCSTWNAYVQECLLACLQLDYLSFGIALLPDEQMELPRGVDARRIQVLPTGRVTIGAKRNRALNAFPEARYFAFLDSDAYPDPAWIRNGIAAFQHDPSIVAVGGPNLTPLGEPAGQRIVGSALRSFLVSGKLAFAKTRASDRFCETLHSCNLIVAARSLADVGGFDEQLRTGEDRELCHRLRKRGGKVYFNCKTVVYHHNRRFGMHLFQQRFVYGHSIYSIAARGRCQNNLVLFIPAAAALVVLACIVIGFVQRTGWFVSGAFLGGYLAVAASEAIRVAERTTEVPKTLAAIVIANVGYVAGSIAWFFIGNRDLMRLYENYRSGSFGDDASVRIQL